MVHGMNLDTGQKTWLTPPWIIHALGEFDLDPCCPPAMPWVTAKKMVCQPADGLAIEWKGRVWLNPPYGRDSHPFLDHMRRHGDGIALLFGRTDTAAWQDLVLPYASGLLLMRGRLRFRHEDGSPAGTANAPSILVAYGDENVAALANSGIAGFFMQRHNWQTIGGS